jgi:hypothetical protein
MTKKRDTFKIDTGEIFGSMEGTRYGPIWCITHRYPLWLKCQFAVLLNSMRMMQNDNNK